ncbi:E3 ubiquitin-protein ligase SINA-like 3 [Striga hermonthica]|uniref:RING-type E3 ubiquitin transferase n=1 Tax=Striga hermonthica TaxID=68872 RepID=A0A9N7NWP6_STRHE|nr:E3 ubiquitin-protein ligase SINA-like 3 [Striga hermonthica]
MTKVSRNAGNGNTDKVWPNYPRKDPPPKRSRPSSPPNTSKTPIGNASTQDAAVSPPASELKDTTASSSSGSDKESMLPEAEGGSSPSPTSAANVSGGPSEGSRREGQLTANLANPKVLECPNCCRPLFSRFPVYQCTNGHILCSPCCRDYNNKCTICRRVMGIHLRCLEKVVESLTFPCDNSSFGCSKVFSSHRDKLDHEGTCEFIPYYCPFTSCEFSGLYNDLYRHFTQAHPHRARKFDFGSVISIVGDYNDTVVLQERIHSTVFVCTCSVESQGTEVDVVCVGPSTAKGAPFSCDLTAKFLPLLPYGRTAKHGEDTRTPTLLNMKMGVECVQERTEQSCKGKYLFLPAKLMDDRRLELELIIRGSQA